MKVGHKLKTMPETCAALDLLEAHEGRSGILDGITALRALAGWVPSFSEWSDAFLTYSDTVQRSL